jgi:hypothetical protein
MGGRSPARTACQDKSAKEQYYVKGHLRLQESQKLVAKAVEITKACGLLWPPPTS